MRWSMMRRAAKSSAEVRHRPVAERRAGCGWAVLLAALLGLPILAHAESADGFEYHVDRGAAVITRYIGPGGNVTVPDSLGGWPVASIQNGVFFGHPELGSIVLPGSLREIGSETFALCSALTNVLLRHGVTSIGPWAFRGCTNLPSIEIPDTVTSIRWGAFENCTGLSRVVLPKGLTTFSGGGTFLGCTSLTEVELPHSLTNLESGVFYGCMSLTRVVIPQSVSTIGAQAFEFCRGLTNVVIPSGVTTIGDRTFADCTALPEISLPRGEVKIGESAFSGCTSLAGIHVSPSNTNHSSVDGVLFNPTRTVLLQFPGGRSGSYTIPDRVVTVGTEAFRNSLRLTNITFSAGVTQLWWKAFQGCTGLTSIRLPSRLTGIVYASFEGCTGLASLEVPEGVTAIDWWAFRGCTGLQRVVLPDSLRSLGTQAFLDCAGLSTVTLPKGLVALGPGAFAGCSGLTAIETDPANTKYSSVHGVVMTKAQDALVHFPVGRGGPYAIPGSVRTIGDRAFGSSAGLSRVTVPRSVTRVHEEAFSDCPRLTGVYFEGDAPVWRGFIFTGSPYVTVFYRLSASGWTPTVIGRPTAPWVERLDYPAWVEATGLTQGVPSADTKDEDPDRDGARNGEEWIAGTDPLRADSRLELELAPRLSDLSGPDKTPIPSGERAVYVKSVAGGYYGLESATLLEGPWKLVSVRLASTGQTRFLVSQQNPYARTFFRVVVLH